MNKIFMVYCNHATDFISCETAWQALRIYMKHYNLCALDMRNWKYRVSGATFVDCYHYKFKKLFSGNYPIVESGEKEKKILFTRFD